ncbi:DNA-directed RNA polymerase [Candidatus Woesearchaeota archaeon]|nr:DNA-directed RNA polymerase [Candidatus Woesearchaeota archaeon]
MFYELELKSHIRVPPKSFQEDVEKAVLENLKLKYEGVISKHFGIIVCVNEVSKVGEGVIIPGDGAAYYSTNFKVISFKPEISEVVLGKITEITDFGAFFDMGAIDGMIHVSQTMDDFVTFQKTGVLTGKDSKRTLKAGDMCRARIVAISFKDMANPKIGLTMRQPFLGSLQFIDQEKTKKLKTKTTEKEK